MRPETTSSSGRLAARMPQRCSNGSYAGFGPAHFVMRKFGGRPVAGGGSLQPRIANAPTTGMRSALPPLRASPFGSVASARGCDLRTGRSRPSGSVSVISNEAPPLTNRLPSPRPAYT